MNEFFHFFEKVSAEVIFSTSITLLIFITGFLLNKSYDLWKEAKNYAITYEYFLGIVKSNLPAIKQQADIFDVLSKQMQRTDRQNFNFTIAMSLNLDEIEKIDRENLLKHLSKKNQEDKSKQIGIIFNAMNMLKLNRAYSEENYRNFREKLSNYQSSWKKNLDSIFRLHDRFIYDIRNGKNELDDFYREINEIIVEWGNVREDYSIEHTYQNLVEKLITCCRQNTEDKRAQDLLPLTIQAKYARNNLTTLHKFYSEHFGEEHKKLLDKKTEIETALEELGRYL